MAGFGDDTRTVFVVINQRVPRMAMMLSANTECFVAVGWRCVVLFGAIPGQKAALIRFPDWLE